MIELRGISKYFPAGGVTALEGASFDLRGGEIHALLGENGAGKSTLMQILAGYFKPGAGKILLHGSEKKFSSPAAALASGIGMVRQHPVLSPGFKIWEDCILGNEPKKFFLLDRKKAKADVKGLNERWGFCLPLEEKTETLTVSQRQKAAILALLLRDVQCLIFDEPTAVLTPAETENLFSLFKKISAGGKAVVLISHKLDETLKLADRVTILRRGKTVAAMPAAGLSAEKIGALMFGGDEKKYVPAKVTAAKTESAEKILSVKGLCVERPGRPFIRGVDLECLPGKITGIAGVRDSGLETLELALTGFLRPSAGVILLQGLNICGGVKAFRKAGGAYLNADRTGSAVALGLPIRDSLIIHAAGRSPLMHRRILDAHARALVEKAGLDISLQRRAGSLSGGMIQRLALAREFAEDARLLVLAEPGRGLDRPRREELYQTLRNYAGQNKAALLFSTDLDELTEVCDEIYVLRNGVFSAQGIINKEQIRRVMAGDYE
jgi:simple sugar transport system ATP-binding protein